MTFTPTFTQGLLLGQLSILFLVYLILKYLFLDSAQHPVDTSSYHPVTGNEQTWKRPDPADIRIDPTSIPSPGFESAEWFNAIIKQVVDIYRSRLCDGLAGAEGQEIARRRVEAYANAIRPVAFLDYIKIHSVNLGTSSPRFASAKIKPLSASIQTELDIHYTDEISVSLSTSYLFNYPMPSFARLPVSLTISLAIFDASMICVAPDLASSAPAISLSLSPNFTLSLSTESLVGSRAKLTNVPKLHELIEHQVRRVLLNKGTVGWQIPLPTLGKVQQDAAPLHAKKESIHEFMGL